MKKSIALLGTLLLALWVSAALADSTISALPSGGLVNPFDIFPDYNPNSPGHNFGVTFGSAAAISIGTSGATLGLLNTANTYSALQTFLSGDLTSADPVFTGGSILLPAGASSQRPGSPVVGQIRYNTTTSGFEGYGASGWAGIGGAAAGSQYSLQYNAGSGAMGGLLLGNGQVALGQTSGAPVAITPGTSWLVNTGTSGATIPLNNGSLTLSGSDLFTSALKIDLNAISLPTAQTGTVLQVGNADSTATRIEADAFGASAYHSSVRADGTNASPTALTTGDEIGGYNAFGYQGSAYAGPQASFRTYAAQPWTSSHLGTYADIAVTPLNSTTLGEVAYFSAAGIGIGTSTPDASLDLSQKTDAVSLPSGTSSQRPSGVNGMIRYSQTNSAVEAYVGGAWNSLLSGLINLASGVTGTLPVANGGTGSTTGPNAATPDIVIGTSGGVLQIGTTNLINAQVGTSYTILSTDMGKTITQNNASASAYALAQAGTTGFGAGTSFSLINLGAGTATITPTTSTVNLASSLALTTGQSAYLISDGANYSAFLGAGSGGGGGTISLGTSASATNPQRSGQAGSGLYSDASNVVEVAAGGVRAMSWNTVAAATDYLAITPSTNTSSPQIAAVGSDTNINLNLLAKGSSAVGILSNGGGGVLYMQNLSSSGYESADIYDNTTAKVAGLGYGNSSASGGAPYVGNFYLNTNSTSVNLLLMTNNAERVRILGAGGVAIGTTAAGAGSPALTVAGNVTSTGVIKTGGYTVSTLPSGTVGQRAYVTDQTTACPAAGAALTGGGSVVCPVFFNSSVWVGD